MIMLSDYRLEDFIWNSYDLAYIYFVFIGVVT